MRNKYFLLGILMLGYILTNAQSITTPYDFPVKPGTAEWKKFKSGREMAEACNIPISILKNLTTKALVATCMSYPLLHEIFLSQNIQKGVEAVTVNFNGFSELITRKDAGHELLRIYKDKNVMDSIPDSTEMQKGLFTFDFTYLELFLSQPQILINLNPKEKIDLVREAIIKYDNKKERIDIFGDFGLTTSVFVIAKVLNSENKLSTVSKNISKKEIDFFLATGLYTNSAILTAMYNAGKSL